MIGRKDVEAAFSLIRPHVRRTPVIELPAGALGLASPLALKLESLQVSGTFKGRGLQGVLQLVDRAQAIALGGAADEDVQKFLAQGVAHALFLSRTSA